MAIARFIVREFGRSEARGRDKARREALLVFCGETARIRQPRLMNKTILIVDDDPPCRRSSAELLRAQEWSVIEASDGEEGIALAIEHRPAAILCDLLMPRGNGYNLCRAVRGHLELKHTPVLVMSGRDYATDRQIAAEAGANEYLVKPVGAKELYAALERHVAADGARRPAAAPLPSGDGATRLTFWGVRGSIPTPGPGTIHYGGNTSCVEVRADGELIVLDAGTGIRLLGIALAEEFGDTPLALTLLVTHTHWDHIQGFPFFSPAYDAKNRIRVLGYEGASASLAATLAGQMESPYFPIPLAQMPGNLVIEELRELEFNVGKVRVTACYSKHPGVCVGYRLFTSSGSIAYVPDNEWSADEISKLDEGGPCTAEIEPAGVCARGRCADHRCPIQPRGIPAACRLGPRLRRRRRAPRPRRAGQAPLPLPPRPAARRRLRRFHGPPRARAGAGKRLRPAGGSRARRREGGAGEFGDLVIGGEIW